MSNHKEAECKDPAGHWLHICQLRREGRQQDVGDLMTDPGHRCLNCNAVATQALNLCNPSPIVRV